ncbi:hypothetical protein [Microbacterium sp. ZKA21]|uniref:hypothetical protein n=1 Tax=Microbacterium sp. ZKA21 TaxID=3381694 RepID=UPI003D197EA6
MMSQPTVEDASLPKLWRVAEELALTPQGTDTASRTALRTARRARRRYQAVFVLAIVGTIGTGVAFVHGSAESEPLRSSLAGIGLVVSLVAFIATSTRLISDRVFRALSLFGKRVDPWLWGAFISLAYLFAILAVVLAVSAAVLDVTTSTSTAGSKTYAFATALIAVMLAMATSAASAPLLSTTGKPRLYQAHGAQICWTAVLIATILSVMPTALWLTESVDPATRWVLLSILIPIVIGFVGSLFVWHRHAVERLERSREQLSDRLSEALSALSAPSNSVPPMLALRRLETLIRRSPFRSQSPAAPPLTASWEIGEIIHLLLWACEEEEYPTSICSRTSSDAPVREIFRNAEAATKEDVLRGGVPFLRTAIHRLFPPQE